MMQPGSWMGTVVGSIGLLGTIGLGTLAAQEQPTDAGAVTFPIAGLSYDTAVAIFAQYKDQLTQLPGAQGAGLGPEGIVVFTENPDALPDQVEGIPVTAGRPLYPRIAGRPFKEVQAILEQNRSALQQLPGVEAAVLGLDGIRVHTANPDVLPLSVDGVPVFPAPSFGQPINGMPYAEVLEIYAETKADLLQLPGAEAVGLGLDGIYVNTNDPDALPKEVGGVPIIAAPPYTTPIAGLPYREARVIFARHEATLMQIPGVQEVQLASDGILVYTEHPDLLPEELEELPVKALPPLP